MNPLNDSSCGSDPASDATQSTEPLRSAGENETERFSRVTDAKSAELLHELNDVFVSVLLNTQVTEWKLPSYSRLKRNLHEVQRDTQRGAELIKRLLKRLEAASLGDLTARDSGSSANALDAVNYAVANRDPGDATRGHDNRIAKAYCSCFVRP